MPSTNHALSIPSQNVFRRPNRKLWFALLALSILWHLLLFAVPWDRLFEPKPLPLPPQIDVQDISQKDLSDIKKRWKEKGLLINNDPTPPQDLPKPKDARYFSDRNRTVEQEQRARMTDTLPVPGSRSQTEPGQQAKQQTKGIPRVGDLGVPFKLAPAKEVARNEPNIDRSRLARDQALLDKDLPLGAENVLNSERSVYYSYYSRLAQQIAPVWRSRIADLRQTVRQKVIPGEYTATVEVIFDRRGKLLEIKYLSGSGIRDFDRAIEYSWKKIREFPNPPKDLLDKTGRITTGWTFSVSVGPGSQFEYVPPERRY